MKAQAEQAAATNARLEAKAQELAPSEAFCSVMGLP